MASVTGMTASAIDELMKSMVVSLRVSDTGRIIFKNRAGQETDAGAVIAPTAAVAKAYPVGSIYISTVTTNPAELLGVGTWSRFGEGRTLVSQLSSDPDFDANEDVGGAKTHKLTASEMPAHTHGMSHNHSVPAHSHSVTLSYKTLGRENGNGTAVSYIEVGSGNENDRTGSTGNAGGGSTGGSSTPTTSSNGANVAHNNMPPYIVVYMWKRTA